MLDGRLLARSLNEVGVEQEPQRPSPPQQQPFGRGCATSLSLRAAAKAELQHTRAINNAPHTHNRVINRSQQVEAPRPGAPHHHQPTTSVAKAGDITTSDDEETSASQLHEADPLPHQQHQQGAATAVTAIAGRSSTVNKPANLRSTTGPAAERPTKPQGQLARQSPRPSIHAGAHRHHQGQQQGQHESVGADPTASARPRSQA